MILVWGFKSYLRLLGILTLVCGSCGNPAAQRVVAQVRKFTFFWIPLFPVKRQTVMTCTFCGVATALTDEQAAEFAGHLAAAQAAAPAAGQFSEPGPAAVSGPAGAPAQPPMAQG